MHILSLSPLFFVSELVNSILWICSRDQNDSRIIWNSPVSSLQRDGAISGIRQVGTLRWRQRAPISNETCQCKLDWNDPWTPLGWSGLIEVHRLAWFERWWPLLYVENRTERETLGRIIRTIIGIKLKEKEHNYRKSLISIFSMVLWFLERTRHCDKARVTAK